MDILKTNYTNTNDNNVNQNKNQYTQSTQPKSEELTVEEQIEKSAVEVSLSMNAQVLLFAMDASDQIKNNTSAQKDILNFLSGEHVADEFNLSNTGYEGNPITELTEEEANELVGEDGFFGVAQTSQRVADFVFSFSGDDTDILQKGREGIVLGFEQASDMWGGKLPQISYDTQDKILELIDAKIAELSNEDIQE